MDDNNIINWLLEGDVSIQCQVYRDLLSEDREDLRNRIAMEGWGKKFLSFQNEDGHWGRKFYQPKWTSTHYTLLDLKNLGISPANPRIRKTILMLLDEEKCEDGGINPSHEIKESDVCLNGMFLNYAAYFKSDESFKPTEKECSLGHHASSLSPDSILFFLNFEAIAAINEESNPPEISTP